MPSFMIVQLQTSEIKRKQKNQGFGRQFPLQAENQNSTQPMHIYIIKRSYMPSFMIVRLQTSEIIAKIKGE